MDTAALDGTEGSREKDAVPCKSSLQSLLLSLTLSLGSATDSTARLEGVRQTRGEAHDPLP